MGLIKYAFDNKIDLNKENYIKENDLLKILNLNEKKQSNRTFLRSNMLLLSNLTIIKKEFDK